MLIKVMLRDGINPGGSVTMVSSTRGFIGGVATGPYSAACAAQIALMQGYAREYQGVRFNCVAPGWTDTDMGKEVAATGGVKPGAVAQPPGAVANVIVDLVEGEANGAVVRVVDGQATMAKWVWE
jgi:NAD(P)-dependent dehydrogenase (short-subunit alcohol dehydrogenase family)